MGRGRCGFDPLGMHLRGKKHDLEMDKKSRDKRDTNVLLHVKRAAESDNSSDNKKRTRLEGTFYLAVHSETSAGPPPPKSTRWQVLRKKELK